MSKLKYLVAAVPALWISACGGTSSSPDCSGSGSIGGNPFITLTESGFTGSGSNQSLVVGESFVITATLTESGATVPTQVIKSLYITLNGNLYLGESFIFTPVSCSVSSGNDTCNITVQISNNLESGYYNLNMQNSIAGGITVYGESIPFTVTLPPLRIIYATSRTYSENLVAAANQKAGSNLFESSNPSAGIAAADYLCNTDESKPNNAKYKAFITLAGVRIACTTPFCGGPNESGNIDWVFHPNTTYYWVNNESAATTNESSIILSFTSNLYPESNPYGKSFSQFWTGFLPTKPTNNWTSPAVSEVVNDIYGFTILNSGGTVIAYIGKVQNTSVVKVSSFLEADYQTFNNLKKFQLMCVQQ